MFRFKLYVKDVNVVVFQVLEQKLIGSRFMKSNSTYRLKSFISASGIEILNESVLELSVLVNKDLALRSVSRIFLRGAHDLDDPTATFVVKCKTSEEALAICHYTYAALAEYLGTDFIRSSPDFLLESSAPKEYSLT